MLINIGGNMPSKKGKRLVDVLDEKNLSLIHSKFLKLKQRIYESNPIPEGPYDLELEWVEKKINEIEAGIKLDKNDLLQANLYWRKHDYATR